MPADASVPGRYLRALGAPTLLLDGSETPLRRKDLALLVYLRIEWANPHSRSTLASLLWAENTERDARHSLSQALVRLRGLLGKGIVSTTRELVTWAGELPCDAVRLAEMSEGEVVLDEMLRLYAGDFMTGFSPGAGGEDFERWVEQRRTAYRDLAVSVLERCAEEAEAKGDWEDALRLAGRLVEIDPFRESGHRRIMLALYRMGERGRALLHYEAYAARLAREVELEPHPDTRRLAAALRADALPEVAAAVPDTGAAEAEPDAEDAAPEADDAESDAPRGVDLQGPVEPASGAEPPGPRKRTWRVAVIATVLAAVALGVALWHVRVPRSGAAPRMFAGEPRNGESIRRSGEARIFLVFGRTLYEYPDRATLEACTGSYPSIVREVDRLPRWPRVHLPSVRQYPWLRGHVPVISDNRADITAHVLVGCIRGAIPNPPIFTAIFGDDGWERMEMVPDSVLRSLPRMVVMAGFPHRSTGTLIRGSGDELKWVLFFEGAMMVGDQRVLESHCRSITEAIRVSDAEFNAYRVQTELYLAARPCSAP